MQRYCLKNALSSVLAKLFEVFFRTWNCLCSNASRLGGGVSGIRVFSSLIVGVNKQFQPYNSIILIILL